LQHSCACLATGAFVVAVVASVFVICNRKKFASACSAAGRALNKAFGFGAAAPSAKQEAGEVISPAHSAVSSDAHSVPVDWDAAALQVEQMTELRRMPLSQEKLDFAVSSQV
jgi:hypothetical protein